VTRPHVTGTRKAMLRLRDLDSRLHGFPRRGHHVGGGRHAPIDDAPPQGWTLRRQDVRKHPSRDEWAYPVDTELSKVRAERDAELKATERTVLDTAITNAAPLPADWDDEPAPRRLTARRPS